MQSVSVSWIFTCCFGDNILHLQCDINRRWVHFEDSDQVFLRLSEAVSDKVDSCGLKEVGMKRMIRKAGLVVLLG